MKRSRVLFSSTSEHFTRRRVGTVPPILVQVFARRHFQPLMATLAEICQILKSVWTEMFVCIWRHLEVKTTYIQWFYMDTNLKSKVNGKYWKHVLSTVHILSLLSSCKTVAPYAFDIRVDGPYNRIFSGATVLQLTSFPLMTNVLSPTDSILWVSILVRRSRQTLGHWRKEHGNWPHNTHRIIVSIIKQ